MISIPGKIPIHIHPLFFVLMGLIGWMNSSSLLGIVLWACVVFLSVLVHELGHALTALFFGQKADIHLVTLGGVTERRGGRLKLWQEFLVVWNGPLAGFCFGFFAYGILQLVPIDPKGAAAYFLTIIFYANLFWTVVNLFPVYPLDGGKLLSIFLESILGIKGVRLAFLLSSLFSFAAAMLFFAFHIFLGGALFFMLAFESFRSWKSSLKITPDDKNAELQQMLQDAEKDLQVKDASSAKKKLQNLLKRAESGMIYLTATEYLAAVLKEEGKIKEAQELLLPVKKELTPEGIRLFHEIAYQLQDFDRVAFSANQAYQISPDYHTAFVNAIAYASLKKETEALGWLACAIREGLPHVKDALKRSEFHLIRFSPGFQKLEEESSLKQ